MKPQLTRRQQQILDWITERPRRQSSCVSLLLYRPERAAHVSLGQRPRKTGPRNQSPEGANHGRLLNRWCGSRCAVYTVMPVCRTYGHWAPLQGSGSTRCLPGALPQANLCCPVGAKSAARGLDLEQVLLIASERDADSRWAAEQCLRSGLFGVVLLWPGACGDHELRRLQLAAEPSRAVSVLYRPTHYAQQASPAQLRLRLQPGAPSSRPEPYPMPSQPRLQILKARGLNCSPNAPIEVNGLQLLPLYAGVAGNAYAAVNSSQDEPAVIDFRRLEAPMSEKSQLSSV
jgi:hypothetical protein